MKNFLLVLALAIGVVCAAMSFVEWQQLKELRLASEKSEMSIADMQYQVDPQFTDCTEAVMFQRSLKADNQVDSIFCSLPQQKLIDVVTVLLNTGKAATKASIVEEWKSHSSVYDNIRTGNPTDATADTPPNTTNDGKVNAPTGTVNIQQVDTIIDGKPATVTTTTDITFKNK